MKLIKKHTFIVLGEDRSGKTAFVQNIFRNKSKQVSSSNYFTFNFHRLTNSNTEFEIEVYEGELSQMSFISDLLTSRQSDLGNISLFLVIDLSKDLHDNHKSLKSFEDIDVNFERNKLKRVAVLEREMGEAKTRAPEILINKFIVLNKFDLFVPLPLFSN